MQQRHHASSIVRRMTALCFIGVLAFSSDDVAAMGQLQIYAQAYIVKDAEAKIGTTGGKSPAALTSNRALLSAPAESRSVLEWFTAAERVAARSGDLSLDMTAAIQMAVSSGTAVIDMHDYAYRIDGTVSVPKIGVTLIGKGWSAQRGAATVNNGGKMFAGTSLIGPLRLSGGKLTGNVVRGGPGYSSHASGIYVFIGPEVDISGMEITGFASATQTYQVDQVIVRGGSDFHGNRLTGISGSAGNVQLIGSRFHQNGFPASAGQSHDVYFINSTNGTITDSYIGDPVDRSSASLSLRYDKSDSVAGFDDLRDWEIYANTFVGGAGVRVGSDPGVVVVDRKPPSNINVFNNIFRGRAGLRFDDPQNSRSWANKGIGALTVGLASSYPGYIIGYTSENDECAAVQGNALTALRKAARDGVIFKGTTIHNGANPAFREIAGFGGFFAATIVEPDITGTGVPLDAAAQSQYTKGVDIVIKTSKSM